MRLLTRHEVKSSKSKEEEVALARLRSLSEAVKEKERELQALEDERRRTIEKIDGEIARHLERLNEVQFKS